jgi:hypothetical protein
MLDAMAELNKSGQADLIQIAENWAWNKSRNVATSEEEYPK